MQNPIKVETAASLGAQIIGTGQIVQKLKIYLAHQGIAARICPSLRELNLNQFTDYLFWVLNPQENSVNELLINFSRHLQTKLILITLDHDCEASVLSGFLARGLDACAISIYHCYGPQMSESILAVLWNRLSEGLISLPENDQLLTAPLYLDDCLEAICRIAFSSRAFGHSFTLIGSEAISLLSLSFRLRESAVRILDKLPKIINSSSLSADLAASAKRLEAGKSLQREINWRPHYDLSRGLDNTIAALSSHAKARQLTGEGGQNSTAIPVVRPRTSHRFKLPLIIVGFILTAFFGMAGLNQLAGKHIVSLLKFQSAAALAGDISQVNQLGIQIKTLTAFTQSNLYSEAQANIGLVKVLADISQIFTAVLTNSSIDLPSQISKINLQIEELLINHPGVAWRSQLGQARELLPVAQWFLGLDKKRTILLVVQNPAEIRPTGGFISSIGYLVIDKGQFLDLNFVDTYQLDTNLTGEQIAPEPIKKYLGENSLLVRDSNWNPHAPETARTIQKLVARSSGRESDGVVFLSAQGLKYILEATGPILTPLGDEINSANVLDRVAFNSNPEMSQILTGLRQHAIKPGRALSVLNGIFKALRHQELFIAANDSQVARVLGVQSVDGGLEISSCPLQFASGSCANDYLMPVEANLGVNRADYFIHKNREIEISLLQNREISTILKLHYQNPPLNQSRSSNNYKGYLQILLPNSAQIKSVAGEISAESSAINPDLIFAQDKLNLGLYIDIPVGQTRTYVIHYTQKLNFDILEDSFGYNLLLQKQQGSIVPTLVTLSYPESISPLVISQPAISVAGALSFYLAGDQTENISVQFASVR